MKSLISTFLTINSVFLSFPTASLSSLAVCEKPIGRVVSSGVQLCDSSKISRFKASERMFCYSTGTIVPIEQIGNCAPVPLLAKAVNCNGTAQKRKCPRPKGGNSDELLVTSPYLSLTDQPLIQWQGSGEFYTVIVYQDRQLVWRSRTAQQSIQTPPLKRGAAYQITIVSDRGKSASAVVEILSDAELQRYFEVEALIDQVSPPSESSIDKLIYRIGQGLGGAF